MTNYRIFKVSTFTSSSVITKIGRHDTTGNYDRAWGIMTSVGFSTSGSVSVEGGGSLALQTLIPGQIYPCHPVGIQLSAGTASVLS
jgi:hypothetical protein